MNPTEKNIRNNTLHNPDDLLEDDNEAAQITEGTEQEAHTAVSALLHAQEKKMIQAWEAQNGSRFADGAVRPEYLAFIFGENYTGNGGEQSVLGRRQAERDFAAEHPEAYALYLAAEKKRIYESPMDDPAVIETERDIAKEIERSGELSTLEQEKIAAKHWEIFVAAYPDKARVYAEDHDGIAKAVEEAKVEAEENDDADDDDDVIKIAAVAAGAQLTDRERLHELHKELGIDAGSLDLRKTPQQLFAIFVSLARPRRFSIERANQPQHMVEVYPNPSRVIIKDSDALETEQRIWQIDASGAIHLHERSMGEMEPGELKSVALPDAITQLQDLVSDLAIQMRLKIQLDDNGDLAGF